MSTDRAGCLAVQVVTASGRGVGIEFRVQLDVVHVVRHGQQIGILDRDTFSAWLTDPHAPLQAGGLRLSHCQMVDTERGRIALSAPDITEWTLSPEEQDRLQILVSRRHRRII